MEFASTFLRKNVSYFNAHLYIRLKNKAVMFIFIVHLFLFHKLKCVFPVFFQIDYFKKWNLQEHSVSNTLRQNVSLLQFISLTRELGPGPKKPRHRVTAGVAR